MHFGFSFGFVLVFVFCCVALIVAFGSFKPFKKHSETIQTHCKTMHNNSKPFTYNSNSFEPIPMQFKGVWWGQKRIHCRRLGGESKWQIVSFRLFVRACVRAAWLIGPFLVHALVLGSRVPDPGSWTQEPGSRTHYPVS